MDQAKHLLEIVSLESHLLHHNLDVMHIEKNFCDNIINTVMDVPDKAKDDVKARMNLANMYDRNEPNLKHGANGRTLKPRLHSQFLWIKERGCVSGRNS